MSFESIHQAACANGQHYYTDPATGLMVSTRLRLIDNGKCCGSGCRHCPYEPRHRKNTTQISAQDLAALDSTKDSASRDPKQKS